MIHNKLPPLIDFIQLLEIKLPHLANPTQLAQLKLLL